MGARAFLILHPFRAGPKAFDPANLVQVWESRGNAIYWTRSAKGKPYICFYTADGEFPPKDELDRLGAAAKTCPDWRERTVAYLKGRGQSDNQPFVRLEA